MRRLVLGRVAWVVATAALAMSSVVTGARAAIPLPEDDPFYTAPDPIPAVPRGTVLRSRPVKLTGMGIPLPFEAWHVMYASTDAHDRPSAVVATIISPLTPAATTPRPLVSYQTAEDSLALKCAPSYRMRVGDEKEELSLPGLLAQGWAVVVPDYEGLESVYTVGLQAAHGVLDGIRAAVNFAPPGVSAESPVGLWGYSGGGHATAWAAELAPTYAPELNIVGVSAGGVPPDIEAVARKIDGTAFSAIMLAGAVAMSRVYPELTTLWNAEGQALAAEIGGMCIDEYITGWMFKRMDEYTTVPNAIGLPWVQDILAENRLGSRTPAGPLFIFHSVNDELIPMREVNELVAKYCAEGVSVTYYQDLASEHISLAVTGAPLAVANLAARFAGVPPLDNCAVPKIPAVP